MYAKDLYEMKYQFLIKKRQSTGSRHFNDPKAFIEYSNDMQDVYKNINDYNLDKEWWYFDDMIADMMIWLPSSASVFWKSRSTIT